MTFVKICGITNLNDALYAADLGADALGFNFYPRSSRFVSPDEVKAIIPKLPKGIITAGVFVNESITRVAETARVADLNALQLHGGETYEYVEELSSQTGLPVIKAFRVGNDFQTATLREYRNVSVLLDAYSDSGLGGTGTLADWRIVSEAVALGYKVYLAGGLTPFNVRDAINTVRPFAVDACSGIEESGGKKDQEKMRSFIMNAKSDE